MNPHLREDDGQQGDSTFCNNLKGGSFTSTNAGAFSTDRQATGSFDKPENNWLQIKICLPEVDYRAIFRF